MIGDLHCHTRVSDGSTGIDDVVLYAKRGGLDFVAITDHDTMAGVSRAEQLGHRCNRGSGIVSLGFCPQTQGPSAVLSAEKSGSPGRTHEAYA